MKKHLLGNKAPIWFLTLLLVLSLTLGALAEPGTIFPWLTYTMDVALVTADPEMVDFKDAPDGGVMVMVKLVSLNGAIKTEDIDANCEELLFRDGNGEEHKAYYMRYKGVDFSVENGFSTNPEQDGFEMLYFLEGKSGEAVSGAKLVVPMDTEGHNIIVPLDKAPHEVATDSQAEDGASSTASFVLGGVRYTISALEDEPAFQIPNQLDGKEGHVVAFSYPGHGTDAKAANKLLYSGARLRQPNGDVVKPYSNGDNIGNPYQLYFGLSGDVLLADCAFTITSDEGDVEIPLSNIGESDTKTEAEPQATAAPEPTEVPAPLPTEESTPEPAAERDANTFAYAVGGETYELALVNVGYDRDEKAMAVEIELYDHALLDFIWDKELHMPFGCAIFTRKDGFLFTEGVRATVSTPMHMTFYFDTKTVPDLVGFGKLNQEDYAASEDFVLVDPQSRQWIDTFPLSALLENEKTPDKLLESANTENDEPAATPEPAEEPTEEPAMEPAEEPDEEAVKEPDVNASELERAITDVLAQCAESATDEWQLAIYRAGVRDALADPEKEGVYAFALRGFDPDLKALGKYAEENRQGYLDRALDNARAYSLNASLTMAEGEFTAKSVKALQGVVKKAAAASKKAFQDKRMLAAFTDELFYTGYAKTKKAEELLTPSGEYLEWFAAREDDFFGVSAEKWTPFFGGQVKQTLDVSEGPYNIKLTCSAVNMAQLLESARAEALNALCYMEYSQRWDDDGVEKAFLQALANQALALRKKTKSLDTAEITLSVDGSLLVEEAYTVYLESYGYQDALRELEYEAEALPDYAAQEFPKAGWLSGVKKGTQVRVKAPKDSEAYYVILRDYDTDELVTAGFVRPGSTCTLRVPKGHYYFVMASGNKWYGEEHLFGEETTMSKTGMMEVKGGNYYHTVTLKVTEGGNMPIYGADEDDLR